jgi:hypothetical protein
MLDFCGAWLPGCLRPFFFLLARVPLAMAAGAEGDSCGVFAFLCAIITPPPRKDFKDYRVYLKSQGSSEAAVQWEAVETLTWV